mmetsp:Transcript_8129/g.37013  ORF Transcript_8129/g.37013 Transcript_8129/m.37013 type:complete len:274 (+) Transcript_8129:405-1226(+)
MRRLLAVRDGTRGVRRMRGPVPRDTRARRVRARSHGRVAARTLRRGVTRIPRSRGRSRPRFHLAVRGTRIPRARGSGGFRRGQALRGYRGRRRRRGHRRSRRRGRHGAAARRRRTWRWIHSCEVRREAPRPVRPGAGRRVGASRRPGGLRQTQRTWPRRGDARSVHRRHRGRHDRRGRGGTRVRTPAGSRAHRRRARTRRSEHASRPGLGRRNPRGFQLLGQRLATAAGDVRGDRGNLRHRRRRDDWTARAVPARRTRPSVERGTRVASKSVG